MDGLFFHAGILSPFWSILLWVALGVSTTLLPVLPKQWGIVFFFVSLLLRAIYTMGLAPALLLLGTINVSEGWFWWFITLNCWIWFSPPSIFYFYFQLFNKLVYLVSFVGNKGTFTRGYKAVVMDMFFIYHVAYAFICVLGLFVHEFFYSFLVRIPPYAH